MTISALFISVLALLLTTSVIFNVKHFRQIDALKTHFVETATDFLADIIKKTAKRDSEFAQTVKDLELAIELLHTELEKTRKND
jgi:ABC-type sugar transport system permease subunit